jgi:hypothetical protein
VRRIIIGLVHCLQMGSGGRDGCCPHSDSVTHGKERYALYHPCTSVVHIVVAGWLSWQCVVGLHGASLEASTKDSVSTCPELDGASQTGLMCKLLKTGSESLKCKQVVIMGSVHVSAIVPG